jgi:hypothetical protein
MRWLFCNPGDQAEMAAKQAVLDKIEAWWKAFLEKANEIAALFSKKSDWDLPRWMKDSLQAIHPQLMWEYGPAVKGLGHRLVITPETERHLRPMVRTILDRAPAIPGWEFYPHRLSERLDLVQRIVQGRIGEDISDWNAKVSTGHNRQIDVVYYSPRCSVPEDRKAFDSAFVATEALLGEEVLDKWIAGIEAQPMPRKGLLGLLGKKGPPGMVNLDRLAPTVDSVIQSMKDQLPAEPFLAWGENSTWSAFKLTPPDLPDYPGRQDLFVAMTGLQEMWQAAHSGRCFASERFTRCGETFCYIKIEHTDQFNGMDMDRRTAVEDSLNAALKPFGLGGVCGSGTGKRYSYLDLALTDLRKGTAAAVEVLREANISHRAWILFFDDELAREWIGVNQDTPPPALQS